MRNFGGRRRTILRRTSWGLIVLVVILIIARALLPYAIQWYVNRTLDRLPDYDGSIGDVDVALIRGAYSVDDIEIVKTTGKVPVPFFAARTTDFSLQWGALFDGKVVGEINVDHGVLNFVQGPNKQASQTGIADEWLAVVKDLFPLRINRFEIENSAIHFRNFHSRPKVDVALTDVHVVGADLSNTRRPSEGMLASIEGQARAEGRAPLKVSANLNPSARQPTFRLGLSLLKLPLAALNDLLRAYGNFDAEGGTLDLYLEAKAADGSIEGRVKPLAHDVKILKVEDDSGSPLQFIWETLVGTLAEIFENQRREQIGTVIEFDGRFDDPSMSSWAAFIEAIKNAFFKALKPGFESHKVFTTDTDKGKD